MKINHYYIKSTLQMLGRMANLLIKHQIEMSYNGGMTLDFRVVDEGAGIMDKTVWAERLVNSFESLCKEKQLLFEVYVDNEFV